jgi:hypothetical protein
MTCGLLRTTAKPSSLSIALKSPPSKSEQRMTTFDAKGSDEQIDRPAHDHPLGSQGTIIARPP